MSASASLRFPLRLIFFSLQRSLTTIELLLDLFCSEVLNYWQRHFPKLKYARQEEEEEEKEGRGGKEEAKRRIYFRLARDAFMDVFQWTPSLARDARKNEEVQGEHKMDTNATHLPATPSRRRSPAPGCPAS